ncbi:hypothetical protein PNQ29_00615 [Halobacterium salinarum]|uniref:hypothetical protein n=1 Tax=Halobacterium salinarum TaxID=2242 RepID=UPI0025569F39|nr:hypothetical protein [Halobacterium salinarum]MDL0118262.1 hypothetical protein [Halobacterium salinarum]
MSGNNNNGMSGTVEQHTEDSTSKTGIITKLVSRRDVLLVVGGILFLHLIGVITIPFVEQLSSIKYGDAFLSIIVGMAVSYGTVWTRFKKVLDEIYSKNWSYVAFVDSRGEAFGVWKTDPWTLNPMNDVIEWAGNTDTAEVYREGIDKAGRRYAMVRMLDTTEEDSEAEYVLENIDQYPAEIDEDMVIADKEHLSYVMDNLQEDAEFGRKARLSLKSRIKHYVNKISAQLSVMHQHAVNEGTSDPEELFEESIEGFERLELDVDDLGQDISEDLAQEAEKAIKQEMQKDMDSTENGGDSE